jgi:hypothetical protein
MSDKSYVDELDQVTATMQAYIEGGRAGKSAVLKPAFHADANICGYVGPDLFCGPIQGFYDWHDENGPAPGLQARIASIDIVGTAASVRVDMDDWTGHRFTDFFTLVKVDGRWQILSKVFYLHP